MRTPFWSDRVSIGPRPAGLRGQRSLLHDVGANVNKRQPLAQEPVTFLARPPAASFVRSFGFRLRRLALARFVPFVVRFARSLAAESGDASTTQQMHRRFNFPHASPSPSTSPPSSKALHPSQSQPSSGQASESASKTRESFQQRRLAEDHRFR